MNAGIEGAVVDPSANKDELNTGLTTHWQLPGIWPPRNLLSEIFLPESEP